MLLLLKKYGQDGRQEEKKCVYTTFLFFSKNKGKNLMYVNKALSVTDQDDSKME